VTRVARLTLIPVAAHAAVMAVGLGLSVLVARQTCVLCERGRVGVAGGAGVPSVSMGARVDREVRRVVIDPGSAPRRRAMTGVARGGEARGDVRRIGRPIVVGLVTARAGGALAGVDAIRMTLLACGGRVRAGQRKACLRVVEPGTAPGGRRMAALALTRESRGIVVGLLGRACRGQVARLALGGAVDELHLSLRSRRVAGHTVGDDVRASQRESRRLVRAHHCRAIDEAPRRVAAHAVGTELATVDVGVAPDARGGHLPELERPMASGARRTRVRALERERTRVSEVARHARGLPGRGGVTLGARGGHRSVRAVEARLRPRGGRRHA